MELYQKRFIYYYERRKVAEKIAEDNKNLAMQQPDFKFLCFEYLKKIEEFTVEKLQGDLKLKEKKRNEVGNIIENMKKILQTINLTFDDLQPKFLCDKCCDTGFTLKGHFCDCYLDSLSNK